MHTYRYDVSKPEEAKAYQEFCESMPVECFNVYDFATYENRKIIETFDGKEVTLYTRQLFDNQWVSEFGRLMDWYEGIVPNRRLKIGYYLEITEEMDNLRNNRVVCGYCGNQLPVGKTCDKNPECSEYGMKSLKTRYKKGE